MRVRFALCTAAAVAASLAVIPVGVAAAQPHQTVANPARSASVRAALAARAQLGLGKLHVVSGVVRDPAGHALSGVCVLATSADGHVRMTRTSASGRYEMALPRAGVYAVRYQACQPSIAGTAVATAPARRIEVGTGATTALPAVTIRLPAHPNEAAGLQAAGVSVPREGQVIRLGAGLKHVPREPGVSGPPNAGGLTGRVTNPAGKPLAGICVWIEGNGFAVGVPTAKNGTYKFGSDEFYPGRYPVLFTSPCPAGSVDPFTPMAPGPWAPQWYKGKFAQGQANKVRLRAHKVTRGVNAVMQHAAQISGVVTGSDGHRVGKACVFVMGSPTRNLGQAVTNSAGGYKVTGLDPGNYRIQVYPACGINGIYHSSVYGSAWYPSAGSYGKARAVATRLRHVTGGINVVVPKLGTIKGTVQVGGKTGAPLSGICIFVESTDDMFQSYDGVTGKDGAYSVEGLPSGTYSLDAQAGEGCGNGNYVGASYPQPVRVVNGETTGNIDFYLQPGGTLTGTVTDAATKKPVAGVCVNENSSFGFAVTGAAGTYKVDQLPAGQTTVEFDPGCGSKGSYAPQSYHGQTVPEAADEITVTAGQVTAGIDAALLPGATISGKVTLANGRPARGVCATAGAASEIGSPFAAFGPSASSGKRGAYTITNLPPGQYAIQFASGCEFNGANIAPAWFKLRRNAGPAILDVAAGQHVASINGTVIAGGTLEGTLSSKSGQIIHDACLTFVRRGSGSGSLFPWDSGSGSYQVTGLAPGQYKTVASSCDGENFASAASAGYARVRSGRVTRNVNVAMPQGGAIAGTVTTVGTHRPVAGACVFASPAGAGAGLGFGSAALTNADGTYKVVGVNAGQNFVSVYPGCDAPAANLLGVTLNRTFGVSAGKVTSGVDVSLRRGGSMTGMVTGRAAAAVPGACVELFKVPGGEIDFEETDIHGDFTATGLPPGSYKVRFNGGCSDGALGLGLQWYKGVGWSGPATLVTVQVGQTASGIDASLTADGTITGSVTGTGSAPLTGICVSAVPLAGGLSTVFTVSKSATYRLRYLQPGKYRVEFQAGCGKTGVHTQWWQGAKTSGGAKVINVRAGTTVSGISAVLTG